jgi:transposase-like protein
MRGEIAMPYKFDKIPINNEKYDKRVKLTQEDKEKIVKEYESGTISITSLAKKWNVSKRLIQFTLFPERKEKASERFKKNQKGGRYYDKDKHRDYMKNHREHKKELFRDGLLGKDK